MKFSHYIISGFILLLSISTSFAHRPDVGKPHKPLTETKKDLKVNYRALCTPSKAQVEQNINNVRARLTTGGDVWWDPNTGEAKYVVPNVDPASGLTEVSSIFAGAVWIGGFDEGENLKLAAATYRSSNSNDFYAGPLTDEGGATSLDTCIRWDRFFKVLGQNIDIHRGQYEEKLQKGEAYQPEEVPQDVLYWPGLGNPFFEEKYGFELPEAEQGLGNFWDFDQNGIYDPTGGDYPIIEIRGCPDPVYPDEMFFWIYNDAGGPHTETNGKQIQMEIQVQAFAYASNDELNDMTFQRYKLINRSPQDIKDTYFAMWVDPDLGCYTDDYIACDTSRSLAIVYNEDPVDGSTGCNCAQGVGTYCNEVPLLGVDYFRGPLNEFGEELGMSSFTYYNNSGVGNWPSAMVDPGNADEYYNYLDGKWRDGTPYTFGGSAYKVNYTEDEVIRFAFVDEPDDPNKWSMCSANLDFGDRRTIQASGPFLLKPGAINELIVGVVWVADIDYPCPSFENLFSADEIAQSLFNNCFKINRGPDAPDLEFIELDNQLICLLSNDTLKAISNNAKEEYAERGLEIPELEEDSMYVFEGYKVYQIAGPDVSIADLDDFEKARLVFQCDIKNGIDEIYNWTSVPDPGGSGLAVWSPTRMVKGNNDGIRHSFELTEDQFAEEDRILINHKKYYYVAVAYAYNNYDQFKFDPPIEGQRKPYLEGQRNVKRYTAIPRTIEYSDLKAEYGQTVSISRLEGQGAGGNFLQITDETIDKIMDGSFDGQIDYEEDGGPITVQIVNPLDVQDGDFVLGFRDGDNTDDIVENNSYWWIVDSNNPSDTIRSEKSIESLSEQIVAKYGFAVSIGQTEEVGESRDDANGTIGVDLNYADEASPFWLNGIPDGFGFGFLDQLFPGLYNYIKNMQDEDDFLLDPKQAFSNFGQGFAIPFAASDYRQQSDGTPLITPAWIDNDFSKVRDKNPISALNNVDLVFTSDKDLWSRCIVVESSTNYFTGGGGPQAEGGRNQFELRDAPSVGKDVDMDGNPKEDGDGKGMGWFPGYAIDVETGKRLNVFFGEASIYRDEFVGYPGFTDSMAVGADMMWNPTSDLIFFDPDGGGQPILYNMMTGGLHFVYVTDTEYDGCADLRENLNPEGVPPALVKIRKRDALKDIKWAMLPLLNGSSDMTSYEDGLIPNDLTVRIRVENPYQHAIGTGEYNGHNLYTFSVSGKQATELTEDGINEALDNINCVPNPYYAYSAYETEKYVNTVKITNLPAECTVTIYSLDGRFIKQYQRNEERQKVGGTNPSRINRQIIPDIEWDLKNDAGIPIASGVYLIHVDAPGLGERVIKWFGINRQFDPNGL